MNGSAISKCGIYYNVKQIKDTFSNLQVELFEIIV